jgi:ribosomal 30S subunit maturation factor RimM
VTDSGETLGKVTAVEGGGQASRLIVRGRRGELMIPLAQDICDVDLAGRRIVVRPPDGLLDVNA